MPLYIGTAIFGFGILLIDITGVLSSIGEDTDGDGDADFGEGDADGEDGFEGTDDGDDHSESHGSVTMYSGRSSKTTVLKLIRLLRSLVYFSVGFGAVGLFALYTGKSQLGSLLWSIPFGLFIMVVARFLKRIQRSELDSQFKKHELLMEDAVVTLPIRNGGIGKIKIDYEGIQLDRYAKAKNQHDDFKKGDLITIVDITDEFFYVE